MPDPPQNFLSHVEVPLLTPRKRAAFPSPPSGTSRSNKRIRVKHDRQAASNGPLGELKQAEVLVVDDDGEEVVPEGGGNMEIVEHHKNLKLHGTGLTKDDLEGIRATLGPLERVVINGQNHWLSVKHLHQFFYWLAERQRIYERRREGLPAIRNIVLGRGIELPCWSLDPLFAERTSNSYRHQDKDSQFIIDGLVRDYRPTPEPDLAYRTSGVDDRYNADGEWVDTLEEQVFRVAFYWRFAKQATWKYFIQELGDVRWKTYTFKKYHKIALKKKRLHPNEALFTGAYQIHPPQGYGKKNPAGGSCPAGNAIASVEAFMTGHVPFFPPKKRDLGPVPATLAKMNNYNDAFHYLSTFPGMGNYHSLQLALDLSYTSFIDLSSTEWMACGRGAINGLNLIIPTIRGRDKDVQDGLIWLRGKQWEEWDRLGYTPRPDERGMPPGMKPYEGVDLVDLENSLCLYQKYARYLRGTELYHMARGDNPELDWIGSSPWDPHQGEHPDRSTRDLVARPEEKPGEIKFWARVVQEFREEVEGDSRGGGADDQGDADGDEIEEKPVLADQGRDEDRHQGASDVIDGRNEREKPEEVKPDVERSHGSDTDVKPESLDEFEVAVGLDISATVTVDELTETTIDRPADDTDSKSHSMANLVETSSASVDKLESAAGVEESR